MHLHRFRNPRWSKLLLAVALLLSGCTAGPGGTRSFPQPNFDRAGGKADGAHGTGPSLYRQGNRFGEATGDAFLDGAGEVFAARCAGCHGCSNAPCQLKLVSYEGALRGSNTTDLFDGRRFLGTNTIPGIAEPTRLTDGRYTHADGSIDYAQTEQWWRSERDFYSVLDPRGGGGVESSAMHQLLSRATRMHGNGTMNGAELDAAHQIAQTAIDRRVFQCLGDSELGASASEPTIHEAAAAGRSMPFGLPVPPEQNELIEWLDNGARAPSQEVEAGLAQPSGENAQLIASWEGFFNRGINAELNIDADVDAFKAQYRIDNPRAWFWQVNEAGSQHRAQLERAAYQAQHMSRYLYEHMFFARVHFEEGTPGEFFEIVRSRTPSGEPIDEIVRVLPNDSPDDARTTVGGLFTSNTFYYRFRRFNQTIVQKDHITWPLRSADIAHYEQLFLNDNWNNVAIGKPEYRTRAQRALTGPENPFTYFSVIPARIRSRFMIESSKHLVDAMVRGDVCTGSRATYAIRDRFWAWFLDPAADVTTQDQIAIRDPNTGLITGYERTNGTELGLGDSEHLDPDEPDNDSERLYLETQDALLARHRPRGYSLDDLWDGDGGTNPNAWLTILRHGKSATVHYGAVGGRPETLWVLSYANFERLYYDLVVRFEPWANILHKVKTWKVMSYVRAEGEDMFLTFIPTESRALIRDDWTRGFTGPIQQSRFPVLGGGSWQTLLRTHETPVRPSYFESGMVEPLRQDDPIGDLIARVAQHTGTNIDDPLNRTDGSVQIPAQIQSIEDFEVGLDAITQVQGEGFSIFPHATVIRVRVPGQEAQIYSLIANRIYKAHNRIYGEGLVRDPERDTISAVRDLYSSYPELFIDVPLADANELLASLLDIGRSPAADAAGKWNALYASYSREPAQGEERLQFVSRTSPQFWGFFDWINAWNLSAHPVDAGIMDISEYLWPQAPTRADVDPRDPEELEQGPF